MEIPESTQRALLEFASDVITRRLGGNPRPVALPNDPIVDLPAGCFVSLHRRVGHVLRGCIGLLESGQPLRSVLTSAAESVIGDPRFLAQPVTRDELKDLEIEITLLGPMTVAASPLDFEPLQHGIHLTIQNRSGLFLPQVARETGWTREQLLARLCTEKMGFPDNAWQQPGASLRTFTATVIGPVPMFLPDPALSLNR